ncbi:helix-turn-helix transcriptional regulator [Clostridium estertheticum]|uniref:helix-turn-helix transcriptional regulator n=1 Tax=Clostridium estertheticum TaxID=238834 RepID=UPI001C6EA4D0|nr:helix-turn-helix transcriptional regulator [Clostridium estertheticum]MBW9154267.1 helix-turn-helix transcriptional regulator [Clostridium estertheticum]WLC86693.1 helix-turn-helix transcriptional regulator [Clostridium estertheticum]
MNKLKKIRNEKKLTVRALAKKADVSPSFISGIENNVANPTLDVVKRICKALDKKIEEIF